MSLWLKGTIEERGCGGYGCHDCPYQIYEEEDSFACAGDKRWQGYSIAVELWWLLGKPKRGEKLADLVEDAERDENGVIMLNPNQVREAVYIMAGLHEELLDFTGNENFYFNPDEINWDMEEYSRLVSRWLKPDGTGYYYTLYDAFCNARATEEYLRGALRVGKPVLFDSKD